MLHYTPDGDIQSVSFWHWTIIKVSYFGFFFMRKLIKIPGRTWKTTIFFLFFFDLFLFRLFLCAGNRIWKRVSCYRLRQRITRKITCALTVYVSQWRSTTLRFGADVLCLIMAVSRESTSANCQYDIEHEMMQSKLSENWPKKKEK